MEGRVMKSKLWKVVRISMFMIRKGLISKRSKLMMDMNLMMKRGKLLRKSVFKAMSHHHHNHHSSLFFNNKHMIRRGSFGVQEYEFSCSDSPNPVFSHVSKRKHHSFLPCINPPPPLDLDDDVYQLDSKAVVLVPKTPEYNFLFNSSSPLSVRISNYSSEEDDVSPDFGKIDDRAEEFIRMFYDQLRNQSPIQLLPVSDIN